MGPRVGVSREEKRRMEVKRQNRTPVPIKVSVSFEERTAAESVVFVWLRWDKSILSREEGRIRRGRAPRDADRAPKHAEDHCRDADECRTTERTLCTKDDMFARAYVPRRFPDFLRVVDVSLDWGEDKA